MDHTEDLIKMIIEDAKKELEMENESRSIHGVEERKTLQDTDLQKIFKKISLKNEVNDDKE